MAAVELEEVVEDRVGKLESDVQHLQADVTEIKADARQFRSEMLARFDKVYERFDKIEADIRSRFEKVDADIASRFEKADDRFGRIEKAIEELRTQMIRGDLQTRIWMLLSNGTVLAVMAHGFKWI
jgi:predicted RNase H-like nuclease (RuvC/YqgF family)